METLIQATIFLLIMVLVLVALGLKGRPDPVCRMSEND